MIRLPLLVALEVKTGEPVWTGRRGMSRIAHVTPLVMRLDDAHQIVSRNSIGENCQASMAISQGEIIIRSKERLVCIRRP